MKKYLLITAVMMAVCSPSKAQTTATDFKGAGNNNPISANIFCADPTALEYNGRLYVYGTNDSQEFVANGGKGDNTYGKIKSLVVFSTDDMVNWTKFVGPFSCMAHQSRNWQRRILYLFCKWRQ